MEAEDLRFVQVNFEIPVGYIFTVVATSRTRAGDQVLILKLVLFDAEIFFRVTVLNAYTLERFAARIQQLLNLPPPYPYGLPRPRPLP